MKLRLKIFLSILVISLTTLFSSTIYLINRNHLSNIEREQERSLNEFEFIMSSVRNNIDFTTTSEASIKLLLSRYGDYYAGKGIHLLVYKDNTLLYGNLSSSNINLFEGLLSVQSTDRTIQITKEQNQHYFFASGIITSEHNTVLIYARNIEEIYKAREESVTLTALFAAGLILLLSILVFFYSKWITKPIEVLQKGADTISNGDYSVRIPATKDEFNTLGNAFNVMACAVELRTKELEDRAKELQVFIDDLSHEMNTPLTSIQGYAEFLQNANASEEQRQKAADTIRSEAKRMKDIYTKLMALTLARESSIELIDVTILDLFCDLQDTFQTRLQEQQVSLEISCSLTSLHMDQILIHMLLSNLIKNSLQAVPPHGSIQLQAYSLADTQILAVSDNGFGIPEDKISEVTKPFFRVDKSRSRKTGGAGLGLSICNNIAALHEADLQIESTINEGTTVKIIFHQT